MRAEIISIGTELLLGSILNTNARFISQRLAEHAIDVYHQVTVGDNVDRIVLCLKTAAARSDIVISSGGLGPTEDDVTLKALSIFLGKPLVIHQPTYRAILRQLKKHKIGATPLVIRQCAIPQKAIVFQNKNGTAPALLIPTVLNQERKYFIVLPGPPRELEPLLVQKVLPKLLRCARIKREFFVVRSLKMAGVVESQIAEKVTDLLRRKPPLTVGIYARPGEVELKVMAKSFSKSKATAMARRLEMEIRKRLKGKIYGVNEETLSSVVGDSLRKNKKTLSIAESCTGGLVSHLVTQTAGSSDYFYGGVVAYSNPIKTRLLFIPKKTVKYHGAVSRAVAKKMSDNVRIFFQTDYGIGITGIAGPGGGSPKKPVGLVYIALSDGQKTLCERKRFFGSRQDIQSRAAVAALDLLRLKLKDQQKDQVR